VVSMIDAEAQRRREHNAMVFSASQRLCVEETFKGLNYVENW
jgi:hypothetical protein